MVVLWIFFFWVGAILSHNPLCFEIIHFLTDFRHNTPAGTIHFGQLAEAGVKTILNYHPKKEEYCISLLVSTFLSGVYAPQFVLPKIIASTGRYILNLILHRIDQPIIDDQLEKSRYLEYYCLLICCFLKEQKKQLLHPDLKKRYDPKEIVIKFFDIFMDASIFERDDLYQIKYQDLNKKKPYVTIPNDYPYRTPTGYFVKYIVSFTYDLIIVLTVRATLFTLFYNKIYKRLLLFPWFKKIDQKIIKFFNFTGTRRRAIQTT